jgi:hypothetical protein
MRPSRLNGFVPDVTITENEVNSLSITQDVIRVYGRTDDHLHAFLIRTEYGNRVSVSYNLGADWAPGDGLSIADRLQAVRSG